MQRSITRDHSELLALLDQRFKMFGFDKPEELARPYFAPKLGTIMIQVAATRHALANPSDPFAYARMKLHLARGYATVSDTNKDSTNAMIARARTAS